MGNLLLSELTLKTATYSCKTSPHNILYTLHVVHILRLQNAITIMNSQQVMQNDISNITHMKKIVKTFRKGPK